MAAGLQIFLARPGWDLEAGLCSHSARMYALLSGSSAFCLFVFKCSQATCSVLLATQHDHLGTHAACHEWPVRANDDCLHPKLVLCSHRQSVPAATELHRTSSFGGVVPIALTNTHVTADEATHGAPVTGPGIAEPFPSDAAKPSPSAAMDAGEQASQVNVVMKLLPMGLHAYMFDWSPAMVLIQRVHVASQAQLHSACSLRSGV